MKNWGEPTRSNEGELLKCHNLLKYVQAKGHVSPEIEFWPFLRFAIVHGSFVHKLSELLRSYNVASYLKVNTTQVKNRYQALPLSNSVFWSLHG
jgi:hypothetical protein